MAIRYDNTLKMDLNRTVRNFNSKINRLKKLDTELDLPEPVKVSELKKKYTNRKDLKREIENLKLFSERGIEETFRTKGGVEMSKYKYEILKREARRTKNLLTREIKRREKTKIKTFGRTEDVTYAEIGERSYLNLVARRESLEANIASLGVTALERYENLVNRSVSRRNYDFNNLQYNFANEMLMPTAYMSGYDMSKLNDAVRRLSALDEKKFLDLFNDEEIMKEFADYYKLLKKGNVDEKEIAAIHEKFDKFIEDLDVILEDYE